MLESVVNSSGEVDSVEGEVCVELGSRFSNNSSPLRTSNSRRVEASDPDNVATTVISLR